MAVRTRASIDALQQWHHGSQRLQDRATASDFTRPRSPERFDIPEGMLDHSVGW